MMSWWGMIKLAGRVTGLAGLIRWAGRVAGWQKEIGLVGGNWAGAGMIGLAWGNWADKQGHGQARMGFPALILLIKSTFASIYMYLFGRGAEKFAGTLLYMFVYLIGKAEFESSSSSLVEPNTRHGPDMPHL